MARSQSGERSLIGRRSSSDSRTTLNKRDSDAPQVPPVPAAHMESQSQGAAPDYDKVDDKPDDKEDSASVSPTKSPLLSSTSVLSSESLDDVNLDLDEGKFIFLLTLAEVLRACWRLRLGPGLLQEPMAPDMRQQHAVVAVARILGRISPCHQMSH